MEKQKMMHVGICQGEVGKYMFLSDSPEGAQKISGFFENPEKIAYNREYLTYTGMLNGERVSVTSTGIGGPSTGIAVEELFQCGADTMILVGTCESLSGDIIPGDLVIPNGAVRMEGVSNHYLPIEYPAVPDHSILKALQNAAVKRNVPHHISLTISSASYYSKLLPETRPISDELKTKWNTYIKGGATSTSMGCAPFFIITSCLGIRAGAIFISQDSDRCFGLDQSNFEENAILTAIEAMKQIINMDQK